MLNLLELTSSYLWDEVFDLGEEGRRKKEEGNFPHYRLPITDYRLPITDYRLPITDSQSQKLIEEKRDRGCADRYGKIITTEF
jgi:hypothetical protein